MTKSAARLERLLRSLPVSDLLDLVYRTTLWLQRPIAIWRLPETTTVNFAVDLSTSSTATDADLSQPCRGFLMAPFAADGQNPTAHLVRSHLGFDGSHVSLNPPEETAHETLWEHFLEEAEAARAGNHHAPVEPVWHLNNDREMPPTEPSRSDFCDWVQEARAEIARGRLKKVVLSRALNRPLHEDFQPLNLFSHLCVAYESAFVSLVALPGIGTWIGASPELLLSLQDAHLTTVSLAGTQLLRDGQDIASAVWSPKEQEEQQIVTEYIRACFVEHEVHDFVEAGPETVRAGNLLHLQTAFRAHLPSEEHRLRANQLLTAMHPTPAVCGTPKKEAVEFILRHETHARAFYAGFLGPVDPRGRTDVFVNLRCMQLLPSTALLYAGSGITRDSEPEKEWLETEFKLNTLLKILKAEETHQLPRGRAARYKVFCDEEL